MDKKEPSTATVDKPGIDLPPSASKEGMMHGDSGNTKAETPPVPPDVLFDREIIEQFARKDTPARKGLDFDAQGFKHRGYMRMLKDRIESTWEYPKEAARRGISGDLYIFFSIKRDGKLDKVELMRTSGFRDLDEAAIDALKESEPFWPLPDDWEKDTLDIKGHFIYLYGKSYMM